MLTLTGRTLRLYSAVLATVVGIGLLLAHYRYILDGRVRSISVGTHEETQILEAPNDAPVVASDREPPQEPPYGAVVAAAQESTDISWLDHLKAE